MFAKIFGGIAAVSAIAALLFWGLWNSEKVKTKELENRLVLSIENTKTLKTELKNGNEEKLRLMDLQAKNMDMINDQLDKIDSIDADRDAAHAENRQLRRNEAIRALENPFQRGLAASNRVRDLMRGIAGRGPGTNSENSDTTKADNP